MQSDTTSAATSSSSLTWAELAEYERDEAVLYILRLITHPLFRRDTLGLIERDDTRASRGMPAEHLRTLLVYGHVGPSRLPALVTMLRRIRLHHVSDVASAVATGCVAGDVVPHVLLASLDPTCAHARSVHRWQLAQQAMRCGMLHHIGRRRSALRQRLSRLLQREPHTDAVGSDDDDGDAAYMQQLLDDADGTACEQPQPQQRRRPRFAPFTAYYAVLKDERVDVACAAASAPTVLVAWSYTHAPCMRWLQQHIFTTHTLASALQPHKGSTSTAAAAATSTAAGVWRNRLAALLDADPWLRLVQRYVAHVPPRRTHNNKDGSSTKSGTTRGRLLLCPPLHKRATLLLVNVDRDVRAARAAYDTLVRDCGGWRSAEVHLLSLWAGEDGMASEFAAQFGVDALPHIAVLQPAQRQERVDELTVTMTAAAAAAATVSTVTCDAPTVMLPPRIAHIYTARGDDDGEDDANSGRSGDGDGGRVAACLALPPPPLLQQDRHGDDDDGKGGVMARTAAAGDGRGDANVEALLRGLGDEDGRWHTLPAAQRVALSRRVAACVAHSGAPLCFTARVCRRFVLVNPYAQLPRKAVHSRETSHVALRGWLTCGDYAALRDDVHTLAYRVRDAVVAVRVVSPSAPLLTRFDARTLQHRVCGWRHMVTCVVCGAALHVCTTPYYRCLQCTQAEGVLCEHCVWCTSEAAEDKDKKGTHASAATATHAPHHILLRLAPATTRPSLPLLWGPSNVLPLPRFCGALITAAGAVHAGVHCARCGRVVVGVRWKCAVCYEYDLCEACAQWQRSHEVGGDVAHKSGNNNNDDGGGKRIDAEGGGGVHARTCTTSLACCKALDMYDEDTQNNNSNSGNNGDTVAAAAVTSKKAAMCAGGAGEAMASARVHLLSHPLLCIRYACDGDSDVFLRPHVVAPPYT